MIAEIINKKGSPQNVLIVDPNPPGSGMHPTEDMFIYVKFTAYNRDRSTWITDPKLDQRGKFVDQANLGVEGEINFIATQVNYNESTGKPDPPKQKTYATTNYTNIGGISDHNSRGVLEGFGIKNIDIKYNASLVPTVDITFTDVRGAALFDTIAADNRRSPYSIFFKMPYPIFQLSVKGYFGKTVNYCLHMINWTSNFDGTTGNFDISANFIGFQQAFLNDMVLGNIIGAVNTPVGFEILNGIYDDEEGVQLTTEEINKGKKVPTKIDKSIRKIDDFFVKISKLQIEFQDIKEKSPEFDRLRSLNTQKNKLKRLQSFIGTPIIKDIKDQKGKYSEHWPNDPTQVYTSAIEDNSIVMGSEYLSIRDFIVFKSIVTLSIKEYIETLNGIVNDYAKFVYDDPDIDEKTQEDLISSFLVTSDGKSGDTDKGAADNYKNFLVSLWPAPVSLETVYDEFEQTNGGILVQSYDAAGDDGDNPNAEFTPSKYFAKDIITSPSLVIRSEWMGSVGKFSKDSNVQVLDFRKPRSKVAQQLHFIDDEIKIQKLIVEKKLNEQLIDELGFNPTIRDVFRIICNNTQAMLNTINRVSTSAESSGNQKLRKSILNNYITDIPSTTDTEYAWPSVYDKVDGQGDEQIYLGEVININTAVFPEIDFVEKVYKILVAKQKELNNISKATIFAKGLDTDNWFPINPLDFKTNPFIKLNTLNTESDITNEIAYQLFLRTTVLNTYSRVGNDLTPYAEFDGIIANESIFNDDVKKFIKTNLTEEKVIAAGVKEGLIFKVSINSIDYYGLTEPDSMGGFRISGFLGDPDTQKDVDYIILDNSKITNNSQSLSQEIKNNKKYINLVKRKEENLSSPTQYVNYYDSSYNYISKLGYNVWSPMVRPPTTTETIRIYKIKNIETIDSLVASAGGINLLNPKSGLINMIDNPLPPPAPAKIPSPLPTYLIDSNFYNNQTKEGKALLVLTTLPFLPFKDAVLSTFGTGEKSKQARILELPTYYLYFIGGLLWRESFPGIADPINWTGYDILQTPKNYYFTNLGTMSNMSSMKLENALTMLPTKTKNTLINHFLSWINNRYFDLFEGHVKNYKGKFSSISEKSMEESGNAILIDLNKITKMILPTSMILFPDDTSPENLRNGLIVKVSDFNKYFKSFKQHFDIDNDKSKKETTSSSENEIEKGNSSEIKIKLQIYNYFKNINNKWACSDNIVNTCGPSGPLIDSFKFINRGWGDIGNKAVINLNSLLTLSNDLNTSIYFFISKILRDSNFLLQILPNFINFKDEEEVRQIFTPIVNISEENESGGPQYVCIYAGGVSEHLDIKEENKYYFSDDGFSFTKGEIPPDMLPDNDQKLVAFRVAFGSENQTIFKNVSLNQQEHRETSEYFRVLAELIDKRGGTQRSYQGNDLLQLFKTRSYTCKIDALGCMNIQPLMYFDLQNVPFFNGAYMITGVNHNITSNHMTTSFTGLRQSRFTTSYIDSPTVFLNIDLNEDLNLTPINFSNLLTSDILYSIGLKDEAVDQPFIDKNNPGLTVEKLTILGVSDSDILNDKTVKEFNKILSDNGIKTNSQALMFLSNVLANSDYMTDRGQGWSTEEDLPKYIVYEKDSNGKETDIPTTYPDGTTIFDPPGTDEQNKYRPTAGSLAKDLGNEEIGDGYRYRPRGYLYINGKNEYSAFDKTYERSPDTITSTPEAAFRVAAFVWAKKKETTANKKTSNDYAKGTDSSLGKGNSVSFSRTITISQSTTDQQKSFEIFEKVLSLYNVISYNKP